MVDASREGFHICLCVNQIVLFVLRAFSYAGNISTSELLITWFRTVERAPLQSSLVSAFGSFSAALLKKVPLCHSGFVQQKP